MIIFFNRPVQFDPDLLYQWSAQNGQTRRKIALSVEDLPAKQMSDRLYSAVMDIHTKETDHASVLCIRANPLYFESAFAGNLDQTLGIFLNQDCGYHLAKGQEIWVASSLGGPKNSESRIGLYQVGSVIIESTYANRRIPAVYELTRQGWTKLPEINEYLKPVQEKLV